MPRVRSALILSLVALFVGCGGGTHAASGSSTHGSGATGGSTNGHVIGSSTGGHGSTGSTGSTGSRGSTTAGSTSTAASSTGSSTTGSSTTGAPDATQHQALPAAEQMGSPGNALQIHLTPDARPTLTSPHYRLKLGVTPPTAP